MPTFQGGQLVDIWVRMAGWTHLPATGNPLLLSNIFAQICPVFQGPLILKSRPRFIKNQGKCIKDYLSLLGVFLWFILKDCSAKILARELSNMFNCQSSPCHFHICTNLLISTKMFTHQPSTLLLLVFTYKQRICIVPNLTNKCAKMFKCAKTTKCSSVLKKFKCARAGAGAGV